MRIKFIEQLKFRLAGRSVPVMRASEINWIGRVGTLTNVGDCKDRPNSLVNTWDSKGWEKVKETQPIIVIDQKGNPTQTWIVSEDGNTVNLYTKPVDFPKREEVVGRAATMDDIADAMDLGRSMRNVLIGIIVGAPVWWIVFQVIGAMAK